jgi:dolichol-phosphate mannosyltransferase
MLHIRESVRALDENPTAELAIVIPTLNECANVAVLVERLGRVLRGCRWEVIFVDDGSVDGTVRELETACRENPRLRCLRRLGRRGLSSAVVEGIQSTFAPFVAVMDADLQHDEQLLVPMLEALRRGTADIVVGSRYCAQGEVGDWSARRQSISRVATRLSRLVLKGRTLSDPMSGFFMVRHDVFDGAANALSLQGYKILLDLLASSPADVRVLEMPYRFGTRLHGASKLDAAVVIDYLLLLVEKVCNGWLPARFVLFMGVGLTGVVLHMAALAVLLRLGLAFVAAQALAALVAMTGNFFLNNVITYRDRRLHGLGPLLVGLLSFYLVCAVGAVANVGIASVAFSEHYSWWLSGLCGIVVGAVWNYAASSVFTWRKG